MIGKVEKHAIATTLPLNRININKCIEKQDIANLLAN